MPIITFKLSYKLCMLCCSISKTDKGMIGKSVLHTFQWDFFPIKCEHYRSLIQLWIMTLITAYFFPMCSIMVLVVLKDRRKGLQ